MSPTAPTVVLGGTGYLGSAVCRLLRRTGPVTSVSRQERRNADADHVVADLSDPPQVHAALTGAGAVVCTMGFRTAGTQWRLTGTDLEAAARRVNVGTVVEVVRALATRRPRAGVPPLVVLASSMAVHGDAAEAGYAAQKREAERVLADAAAAGVVRAVSLQLATVYGAASGGGDGASVGSGVVAAWARAALRGEPLRVWDDGAIRRDLVHVDDVARAVDLVLRTPDGLRPTYQLGSGTGRSLRWIAERVALAAARHTGARSDVLAQPAPAHAAPSDLRDVVAAPAPFTEDTGWSPRVDPEPAIVDVVDRLAHAEHKERA